MSVRTLPRFIDAESVSEGDLIRVTWSVGDVQHTRQGRVHRIIHNYTNGRSRIFATEQGNEIFRYVPGVKTRVTLIENAPPDPPEQLFDDRISTWKQ